MRGAGGSLYSRLTQRAIELSCEGNPPEESQMLKWAVIFAIIALVAGMFGFTGIAAGAAGIAKILFVVFLVLFVAVLLFALLGAKALGNRSGP
jgi:uncharacterized membrane protein YtjA (UPF0391 family)